MDEKFYFSTDVDGYINEPVMIGNTRLALARVKRIDRGVESIGRMRNTSIVIEGDLFPWRAANVVGRACNYFPWIVEKVIFSGPTTIVFWNDNTKTVVRLAEGWVDDRYEAICWAMAKKFFGTRTQLEKRLAAGRSHTILLDDSAIVYTILMTLFNSEPKELDKYVAAAVEMAEDYREQK